jgi:hypothetical protein
MALPAVFRRKVGRDLAGAFRWYEDQRVGLGEEFLGAVDASFEAIQEFPARFARVHGEVRRAVVEPKRLVIIAVLHMARDPKLWPQPRKARGAS